MDNAISTDMVEKRKEKKEITLRPYQEEFLDIINNKTEGRYLCSLATGMGKTVLVANMKRRGRMLILSHRDELVHQPEKYFDCSFGVEKAEEESHGEEVVSASVQSLCKDSRLAKFSPDDFYTIVIDEAHHAAAPSYRKILDYFSGAKLRLGVTATPRRGDKVRLTDVFDEIIFDRDLKWGINNGYLTRIRCKLVRAGFSLKKVKKTAGDYNQYALERVTQDAAVIAKAARAYIDECYTKDKHTLLYCVTKKICFLLLATIRSLLPEDEQDRIQVVTGDTPQDERNTILGGFNDGYVRGIINCMVLTEGTDLPICDSIVNMRPTQNPSLYTQCVGRATRLYPGKEFSLIVDVVPDDFGSRAICTAPTLFGLDPAILKKDKQEKISDDETDLIDFCDDILGECLDLVKRISIQLDECRAFVDDVRMIINENKNEGFSSIAKGFEAREQRLLQDSDSDELDFGDLDVKISADASKRYVIHPTFWDTITVSEPDVLNNVVVDFFIDISDPLSKASTGKRHITGEMKADEAVKLVQTYCLSTGFSSCAYSKSAREQWSRSQSTPAQQYAVQKNYRAYGVYAVDTNISKLEASDLLDMSNQLKVKETEIRSLEAQKRIAETKKPGDTPPSPIEEDPERNKQLFDLLKNTLMQKSESIMKREEERLKKENEEKEKMAEYIKRGHTDYVIPIREYTYSDGPASDKQISYTKSLADILKQKRCHVGKGFPYEALSKPQASTMIEIFKFLDANLTAAPGYWFFIENEPLKAALRLATENENAHDVNISCRIIPLKPQSEA